MSFLCRVAGRTEEELLDVQLLLQATERTAVLARCPGCVTLEQDLLWVDVLGIWHWMVGTDLSGRRSSLGRNSGNITSKGWNLPPVRRTSPARCPG